MRRVLLWVACAFALAGAHNAFLDDRKPDLARSNVNFLMSSGGFGARGPPAEVGARAESAVAKVRPGSLDAPVPQKGYLARIQDSLAGFVLGWILVFICLPFMFLLELESVSSLAMIRRAKRSCFQISSDHVSSAFQNCMVHVSGRISTEYGQRDSNLEFAPIEKAAVLKRTVEVLQWVEEKKTDTQSSEAVYSYRKEWREGDVPSSQHRDTLKQNPPRRRQLQSEVFMDAEVNLGAFKLRRNVLSLLSDYEHCTLDHNLPPKDFVLKDRMYCLGSGEDVGDMRIFYTAAGEQEVSICAVQSEDSFRRFRPDVDGTTQTHLDRAERWNKSNGCAGGAYELVEDEEAPAEESCCCCLSILLVLLGLVFPRSVSSPPSSHARLNFFPQGFVRHCSALWTPHCCFVRRSASHGTATVQVLLVKGGTHDVEYMFDRAVKGVHRKLLALRVASYVLLVVGLALVFGPIAELLSFLPFVDALLRNVFLIVAMALAAVLQATVLAVSWVYHHPEVLGGVLAGCGSLFCLKSAVRSECSPPLGSEAECHGTLVLGYVLLGLSLLPGLYWGYLQIQENRFISAVKAEMQARQREGGVQGPRAMTRV